MGRLLIKPKVVARYDRQIITRWLDSNINKTTCAKEDNFDVEIGYAMCLLKHCYRGKEGKELLAQILADIRIDLPKKKGAKK